MSDAVTTFSITTTTSAVVAEAALQTRLRRSFRLRFQKRTRSTSPVLPTDGDTQRRQKAIDPNAASATYSGNDQIVKDRWPRGLLLSVPTSPACATLGP